MAGQRRRIWIRLGSIAAQLHERNRRYRCRWAHRLYRRFLGDKPETGLDHDPVIKSCSPCEVFRKSDWSSQTQVCGSGDAKLLAKLPSGHEGAVATEVAYRENLQILFAP